MQRVGKHEAYFQNTSIARSDAIGCPEKDASETPRLPEGDLSMTLATSV